MGLLDGMFGLLSDKDMQLALAASLLGARKGQEGQAIGQGLLQGNMMRNNTRVLNSRDLDAQQMREMHGMQMEQMRRAQQDEQGLRGAFRTAFQQPNPNIGTTSVDDQGSPIPQAPGGGGLPEFLRLGGQYMNPMQAVAAMQKQGPMKLGKDDRLVDPTSFKELVGAAPGDQWEDIGRDPKTGQNMQRNRNNNQLRAVGTMPTQVSVNQNIPPLEKREQGDQGALNVKNYGDLQTAAASARKENAILTGLERIPLDTGKTTPANVTLSAWVAALGGGDRFKNVASQGQAFTGFATDLVLQKQLAQKGPQTESDARRLEQTAAQLGNTPEANGLLVAFSKAQNQRVIDQERFYADYWKKKKTYEGADHEWFSGKGGTSVWDEPSLKKYQSAGAKGDVVLQFNNRGERQ